VADTNQRTRVKLKWGFSFSEILAFLLIIGQTALYAFMWLRLLGDPSLKTMDFISLYATGRLIRSGDYRQIYNPEAEAVIQRGVAGSTYDDPLIFNHPPHVTPILGLIASDDYVLAYIYWTISGLLVLSVCVELIRRFLLRSGWDARSAWLGAFGSVTFFPIFISLLGGQDTVYTLIGLLVWMFALLKRDEIFAGLGLAFAALSPTIAGALALPLLASRRRAGGWFIAGMLGLAVYSLALVGWQGGLDFLYLLRTSSAGVYYGINWSAMYNLLGLLVRTFPTVEIETIRLAAWIFAALSILSMCIFWWNKQDRLNIRHIGIAVVLSTFTAPHLHLHGLSFLILPLLGMITLLHERGNKKTALILIPAVSTVLLVILFVAPDWSYAAYDLLMAAMVFVLIVSKPLAMPQKNPSAL
jgi:hypothetical protein